MNDLTVKEDLDETNEFIEFEKQKIYSAKAIWGFSIVFAPIFGGVLLMQNLRDTDRKKEANLVLLVSILLTLFTILVVNLSPIKTSSFTFICNIIGGGVLSYYFQKKYFPDEDKFEKKTIWKALIISILIIIPFVFALIYSMQGS
ncbi:hypothetical protein [uncultured Flavobacterium sp.]|uniref:hypothetical protein n=1 Tax=uncultured Flavobacterium sp. TaxID=165435 RepID=UPI0030812921